uniref:Uncharacterized protein n=1 Tax=Sciurus vulgaris TaxID=55149 RepID=A0A8D2D298_SCIVU
MLNCKISIFIFEKEEKASSLGRKIFYNRHAKCICREYIKAKHPSNSTPVFYAISVAPFCMLHFQFGILALGYFAFLFCKRFLQPTN